MSQQTTTTASGSAWGKVTEFAESLAAIYGGVKVAESQADMMRYEAQLEAMRSQQYATTYDTQNLPNSPGVPVYTSGSGGNNDRATLMMVGLVGVAVFLLARG